jgi:hypothetical protein
MKNSNAFWTVELDAGRGVNHAKKCGQGQNRNYLEYAPRLWGFVKRQSSGSGELPIGCGLPIAAGLMA